MKKQGSTLPTLSKHSTRELLAMHERVKDRIEADEEYHLRRARELDDLRMFETLITDELNRRRHE